MQEAVQAKLRSIRLAEIKAEADKIPEGTQLIIEPLDDYDWPLSYLKGTAAELGEVAWKIGDSKSVKVDVKVWRAFLEKHDHLAEHFAVHVA